VPQDPVDQGCTLAHVAGPGEDMGFLYCCSFLLALKQLERRHRAARGAEACRLLALS